jgi:hypothetical protein
LRLEHSRRAGEREERKKKRRQKLEDPDRHEGKKQGNKYINWTFSLHNPISSGVRSGDTVCDRLLSEVETFFFFNRRTTKNQVRKKSKAKTRASDR